MRTLFWIIGLFALAVALTLGAQLNAGNVLVYIDPWRIKMSRNTFFVLLMVLMALMYFLVWLGAAFLGLPEKVRRYREHRRLEYLLEREREARLAFDEGRYQRAERLASEAAEASRNDQAFAANLLLAARSAHFYRDFARQDECFALLRKRLGGMHLATAMTMAELFLDERRYQDAGLALEEARALSPKLTAAQRMELRLRQREENHDAVLRLVEQLHKGDALDDDQAQRVRTHAYLGKLRQQVFSAPELREWWRRMPEADAKQDFLVRAVAEQFVALEEPELARDILEKALQQEWSSNLAQSYGSLGLTGAALLAQIAKAEDWLRQQPGDHNLLLSLGRLCRAASLWGKAQNYLEASLAVQPSVIAHAELGELCEQLDRTQDANRHYRQGLALALQR